MTEQGFQLPEPGAEHGLLKPFEGTFKSEVKMWFGPGEPNVSTGTIANTWQLGGLYLNQVYKGDRADGPFPNFEGYGYWGYNQSQNRYEGFWIDNASTTMQIESGTVDGSGKVFEMHSEFLHGGTVMKKRTVFEVVSNDEHKMTAYVTPPEGEEMKSMEIIYNRV